MSRYTVYVVPRAWCELQELPGHMRQRVRRAIGAVATLPRPSEHAALTLPASVIEVRRIRRDRWRIVDTVADGDQAVDVVAVRKRPPYDYGAIAQRLADYTYIWSRADFRENRPCGQVFVSGNYSVWLPDASEHCISVDDWFVAGCHSTASHSDRPKSAKVQLHESTVRADTHYRDG